MSLKFGYLTASTVVAGHEKKEEKMGENWIKLLKTNAEKMSVFRLAIMLQKTSRLWSLCHYINENKGSY